METVDHKEEKMMRGFKKGNAASLRAVFDIFHDHLYYFAYRLTGNMTEAEDIVMEALGIVLRRYTDFETIANIKAFLYITVRNRSLKYLQHMEREKELQNGYLSVTESNEDYFFSQYILSEIYKDVYEQIENLPPMQRKVVKMAFMDGLSITEISEKLDISKDAVTKNKNRALKQLKHLLTNKNLLPLLACLIDLSESYLFLWISVHYRS